MALRVITSTDPLDTAFPLSPLYSQLSPPPAPCAARGRPRVPYERNGSLGWNAIAYRTTDAASFPHRHQPRKTGFAGGPREVVATGGSAVQCP